MYVWALLQWTWRGTFEAILYTRNAESIIFKINFHNNFDPLCSEWITYGHASLPSDLEWIELHRPTGWKRKSLLHMWFDLILFSSLNKIHCIKHLTSVRRAPVRSSLANQGAKPSRQARETVHLSKMRKKNRVCKKHCTRRQLYQCRRNSSMKHTEYFRPITQLLEHS